MIFYDKKTNVMKLTRFKVGKFLGGQTEILTFLARSLQLITTLKIVTKHTHTWT